MITPGSPLISCSSLPESRQKPIHCNKGLWAGHAVDSSSLIIQADSASPIYLGNVHGHAYLVQPGCPIPHSPSQKPKAPKMTGLGSRVRLYQSAFPAPCPP